MYYGSQLLASPIPSDINSPVIFLSALEGTPNLLSSMIRPFLGIQPTVLVFVLVAASVLLLFGSLWVLLEWSRIGLASGFLAAAALLLFPALDLAMFTDLLMVLLPASLVSIGLALASRQGATSRVAGLILAGAAAFFNPVYALLGAVITTLWLGFSLLRHQRLGPAHAIVPVGLFAASLAGFEVVAPIKSIQPTPSVFYFQQNPAFFLVLGIASAVGLFLLWHAEPELSFGLGAWAVCSLALAGNPVALLTFACVPICLLGVYGFGAGLRRVYAVTTNGWYSAA